MKNLHQAYYAKTVELVERGVIGKPQIIIVSVNTLLKGQDLVEKIGSELTLIDGIINKKIKNQSQSFFEDNYAHGFIAREYQGGQIIRYTYTAAPVGESTQLTVYGNDGEIRFDSIKGELVTLKQIPDYVGDKVTEKIVNDGVIDFSKGKIGKVYLFAEAIEQNIALAKKIAKI